ncbi:hypothetical protein [Candidatus Williamhamiltonella defendens]|uniref:hypothetical protein n=1 Tax=Candidatus Williamhamiltonella defendens TaxID=138072 RepID=UPI0011D0A3E4|nr:hypothetical protein [Candidatus Hamiltonella defensa]
MDTISGDRHPTPYNMALKYIWLVSLTENKSEKQRVIEMSLFFDKPTHTKRNLIKHGWQVDGHNLISPEWWSE